MISFLGLAIFVCCFAGVVAWILGSNAIAFVRSDMDSALAAGLYSAFVGFGLICTLVLFFAALLGFTKIRSTKEATPFQIATLFKLVLVSIGLVVAFAISFAFALLRIGLVGVVVPIWAFLLIGVLVPLCLVLAW